MPRVNCRALLQEQGGTKISSSGLGYTGYYAGFMGCFRVTTTKIRRYYLICMVYLRWL